jgi:hypothetical protein
MDIKSIKNTEIGEKLVFFIFEFYPESGFLSFSQRAYHGFDTFDDEGNITGHATREKCHGGSFLLHGVVHVPVFNRTGAIEIDEIWFFTFGEIESYPGTGFFTESFEEE